MEELSVATKKATGLTFSRNFTTEGVHPYDQIEWIRRDVNVQNEKGEVVFSQPNVETPSFWSQTATNIVAMQYLNGEADHREDSVKQLIDRVVRTIRRWGVEGGYFDDENGQIFEEELTYLLVNQYFAFNSPVWYNVGIEEKPQCSACFIVSVEDTMESILELAKTEGMLFKWGSGTGSNLSTLRGSKELLKGGGTSSGPVSFMRGYDTMAGVIKSGGKTRRAAKMVVLNADHPDILQFIRCKAEEEKLAHQLVDLGYNPGFNVPGGAYEHVNFQNANHSVRVTDEFMKAVLSDEPWHTREVVSGQVDSTYMAKNVMSEITNAAWICGDPGMQFHTTANAWHTCGNTAAINGSNPCGEYMFLDDSACNLASLNLMKFRPSPFGGFDTARFADAIKLVITAQEILVGNASYPTARIAENSHNFRPLGLGYANLGALLMSLGYPYDSETGRAFAASISSVMCSMAYVQSAKIAAVVGPFAGFEVNKSKMISVIEKHREAAHRIPGDNALVDFGLHTWDYAVEMGLEYGFRNAQVTVIAPTGTIGFMMDCDTTGVEPDIALVKYKKLVGGGHLKIVNQTVSLALEKLGYLAEQTEHILAFINKNDTIEGAPHLKEEHLPIFDCAFTPAKGNRSIHYMGHVLMMASIQPFVSGAISKTVNMPHDATPQDIESVYIEAWRRGLKAVSIYRDGCKRTQPLSTTKDKGVKVRKFGRVKLPDERKSITHKFTIGGHDGYLTVGMYEDGSPGELFITMSKEGSTISGLMDAFATSVSIGLQYGVPLSVFANKFMHTRFDPSGLTTNPAIRIARSVCDYVFQWLLQKFPDPEMRIENGNGNGNGNGTEHHDGSALVSELVPYVAQLDAPPCGNCGMIMIPSGSCYKCGNCGSTSSCS